MQSNVKKHNIMGRIKNISSGCLAAGLLLALHCRFVATWSISCLVSHRSALSLKTRGAGPKT